MRSSWLIFAMLLVTVGCGGEAEPSATGGTADASAGQELGPVDTSAAGDAAAIDGTGVDGSSADSGTGTEAGAPADAQADVQADAPADTEGDGTAAVEVALDSAADTAPSGDAEPDATFDSSTPSDGQTFDSLDVFSDSSGAQDADAEPAQDAVGTDGSAPDSGPDAAAETAAGPDGAACVPTTPSTEVCDGVDNDCDGKTDDSDPCEDGNPCTLGFCSLQGAQKQCAQKPGPSGQACDDGDPCSNTSACSQGICAGASNCSDGVVCTLDSCDPVKGCVYTASDAKCADGNNCTSDACDAAKGCSNLSVSGSCDDGDACSTGSECAGGACIGNLPLVCDDKKPCTTDTCDTKKGCIAAANSLACDDANPCTSGEVCANSNCQGGKPKCDDGDLCTADSCDATGVCANTALPNCKACTAASQCSDSDACTTDNCTAGKCAWTAISGCVGPTNYVINSFTSNKATLTTGSVATFSVGVTNLGKPWAGGAVAKLKWEVWFSTDAQLDASDVLAATKTWSSYNIGAPNQTAASESLGWSYARPAHWYHKFQCAKLVYSADANLADNVSCIPVVIEDGEVGLVSVIATGSKVKSSFNTYAQPSSTVLVETTNPGTKAFQPSTTVYVSQDDKWDAGDKPISLAIKATVALGKSTTTLTFPTLQFQSTIQGKLWICVRSDGETAQYELAPGDNTVCGQVDVENPAELVHGDPTYTNGYLTFDQTGGTGTATWGAVAACKKLGVYNVGLGKIQSGFAARCFLSTTGAPADAGWTVQWQHQAELASGMLQCGSGYTCGAKVDITSPTGPKVETLATGASKLCVEVNYDKAVLEADYTNNTLCVPVTVVGPNMQVNPKLTAENGGVAVGLKAGVAWSGTFAITNVGNADLSGVDGKFLARIYLSADNKISAEDTKLWEGVQSGFNSFTKQVGQFPNHYALPTSSTKPSITVPIGTAPGGYFLLYHINADAKFAEPLGDNVFAKPVTLSQ